MANSQPQSGDRIEPTRHSHHHATPQITYRAFERDAPLPFSTGPRYFPVYDPASLAIASGGPTPTIFPPRLPPSGPRSITQSAVLITSRLCSITTIEPPASIRRRKAAEFADIVEMQPGCRLVE